MRKAFLCRQYLTLLIIFFVASVSVSAQGWDTLPFKSYADYKLQPLNKNNIPTGILYDRAFPIANVDEFTGNINTSDTTSPGHFSQAYYETYNAAYSNSGWLSPDSVDKLIKTVGNSRQHPIGIFLYNFNSLDTNALQDHLIDTLSNGQFTDVQNPSRSPYFNHTSFIASPLLAEGQVIDSGVHQFYLDSRFFLQNTGFTITQVRVDFGDGQGEWVVNNPFSGGGRTKDLF